MQGRPVRTVSGTPVGKVQSFDLDADTGAFAGIRVIPRGAVAGLLAHEQMIARQSIVSLTEEEVVIEDAFVPYSAAQFSKIAFSAPASSSGAHLKTHERCVG